MKPVNINEYQYLMYFNLINRSLCVLTDFEHWDELRQRNHQEKEIVEVLELVE
jgi:hypothetical protein